METILDLDALLDGNLNDVKDVPDFVTPPEGAYMLAINDVALDKREDKDKVEKVVIVITYSVAGTLEVKDMPVADGSLFTERFQYTEDGKAYFKRAAKNILNVDSVDGASLRDIFAALKDSAPFKAAITHSTSTVGEGANAKNYTNLRIRPVHAPA